MEHFPLLGCGEAPSAAPTTVAAMVQPLYAGSYPALGACQWNSTQHPPAAAAIHPVEPPTAAAARPQDIFESYMNGIIPALKFVELAAGGWLQV
jgi:hypothetical protein